MKHLDKFTLSFPDFGNSLFGNTQHFKSGCSQSAVMVQSMTDIQDSAELVHHQAPQTMHSNIFPTIP